MDNDKEIPEDVFRKDFGGGAFEEERHSRREGQRRRLALGGLLALLAGPALLTAIGVVAVTIYYCRFGSAC